MVCGFPLLATRKSSRVKSVTAYPQLSIATAFRSTFRGILFEVDHFRRGASEQGPARRQCELAPPFLRPMNHNRPVLNCP
jgi:hypothetical protein